MIPDKVIGAATEAVKAAIKPFVRVVGGELAGMVGDQLRFRRWKTAIKILERARQFCEMNNIPVKSVPIKFIVPFLDAASLEEGGSKDKLTDLWASLLASAVTTTDARHYLFIERLRALSTDDAKYISKFVKFLLLEKDRNVNQFRDSQFDPDSWNIQSFEEFRFHFRQHLDDTTFRFKNTIDPVLKYAGYTITPEPTAYTKRYIKSWPPSRPDLFFDYFGWEVFNTEGFYGGSAESLKPKHLAFATVDALSSLGLLYRQVQSFRVDLENGMELRFDARLCGLTSLGFQFLRATHLNEFRERKGS
jgi:hypothetical protein